MTSKIPGRHLESDDALKQLLEQANVRATTQRTGLARLLFSGGHRHVSAAELHLEAARSGLSISMATVYNTLGQFVQAGLLREVAVGSERTWFDTNVEAHGHIYDESSGHLTDVPLPALPLPEGLDEGDVSDVELLFRVNRA